MHIPDGFLNTPVLVATNALAAGALAPALSKINRNLTPERIPLMGVAAAFTFTVQLIRFPVPGGTSVHISAGVLVAVLLGPFTGLVIITAALALQALLFQHGGILTLGANVLNMGVSGCLLGYFIYWLLPKRAHLGAGVAAWVTAVVGALLCVLELWGSGRMELRPGLMAMGGAHAMLGVVEAVVTMAALNFLQRVRPDLLELEKV